ncbi:RNA-directed DNA polymerase from mobile element jockey, partial [Habropoda laboriosa]
LKHHNPDIVLLSETKLNRRHKIEFQNYNIVRNDRINAEQAGGTGIVIRNDIKFKHILPNNATSNKCFESTVIEVKLQNAAKLIIIVGYATSSCKKEFMTELNSLFQGLGLHKSNNYYILAGDLNAKHESWGNTINNNRGVALNKWTRENEIPYRISLLKTAVPSFPSSGAFIDSCLADKRIKFHNTPRHETLDSFEYDSDHRAVRIQISIPSLQILEIDESTTPQRYNFNKADWTEFKSFLTETDDTTLPNNRNLSVDQIGNYIDKLSYNINKAIDHATPRIQKKVSIQPTNT